MAAMSTALTQFANTGDSRTWTTTGHTVQTAKVVVMKRKVPSGSNPVAEISVAVVHSTKDAENIVLPSKVNFTITVRTPVQGQTADVTAALAIIRDIVASDNFGASVTSQNFLA